MNRQLAAAVSGILAVSAYSGAAAAQEAAAEGTAELETVIVTGSWIPQMERATASPVVEISADDIARQGFQNVS